MRRTRSATVLTLFLDKQVNREVVILSKGSSRDVLHTIRCADSWPRVDQDCRNKCAIRWVLGDMRTCWHLANRLAQTGRYTDRNIANKLGTNLYIYTTYTSTYGKPGSAKRTSVVVTTHTHAHAHAHAHETHTHTRTHTYT